MNNPELRARCEAWTHDNILDASVWNPQYTNELLPFIASERADALHNAVLLVQAEALNGLTISQVLPLLVKLEEGEKL
jgi:hypothetical protein